MASRGGMGYVQGSDALARLSQFFFRQESDGDRLADPSQLPKDVQALAVALVAVRVRAEGLVPQEPGNRKKGQIVPLLGADWLAQGVAASLACTYVNGLDSLNQGADPSAAVVVGAKLSEQNYGAAGYLAQSLGRMCRGFVVVYDARPLEEVGTPVEDIAVMSVMARQAEVRGAA